jgi:hypothetical protein
MNTFKTLTVAVALLAVAGNAQAETYYTFPSGTDGSSYTVTPHGTYYTFPEGGGGSYTISPPDRGGLPRLQCAWGPC